MTKKLKDQAKYDQAVKALEALGITPGAFCLMTRAMDIVQALEEPDLLEPGANFQDLFDLWEDSAFDDFEYELKEAWEMLEDVTC